MGNRHVLIVRWVYRKDVVCFEGKIEMRKGNRKSSKGLQVYRMRRGRFEIVSIDQLSKTRGYKLQG